MKDFYITNEALLGLPRACPSCGIVAHYDLGKGKIHEVECLDCGFEFVVTKYKRGERPK